MKRPIVGDAGISLSLRTNLFLGTREMGKKILEYLIDTGDIFVPERFDAGRKHGGKLKFDPSDLSLPLEGWVDDRYSLGIIATRYHPIRVSLVVGSTDFRMFDYLDLSIASKWFVDKTRLDRFSKVALDLYGITQANYGHIRNWRHEVRIGDISDENGNLIGHNAPKVRYALPGLFWANFFGPEYVEMFRRDKLLSAPWYSTKELPDGGILALISESPLDAPPEYQARKKELYAYLGDDAFSGAILPKFRTEGRKKRDARPLVKSGGIRDDVFH